MHFMIPCDITDLSLYMSLSISLPPSLLSSPQFPSLPSSTLLLPSPLPSPPLSYVHLYRYLYLHIFTYTYTYTVSFHNFKSQKFKLSVSNPKNKYVAYVSVLSQISNFQSLGRKNKHAILKADRNQFFPWPPGRPYRDLRRPSRPPPWLPMRPGPQA